MFYKGLMDGWHGDEDTYHDKYCFCEECEQFRDKLEDSQYEQYKYACESD